MMPIIRSTIGLSCVVKGASAALMSYVRRGTPNVPANVIAIEKMTIPPAKRYGWMRASFQKATCFRKISGII